MVRRSKLSRFWVFGDLDVAFFRLLRAPACRSVEPKEKQKKQEKKMESPVSVRVWCHSCTEESTAFVNTGSGELYCDMCLSSFVEEVDQGVEAFLESSENNAENQEETENITFNRDNSMLQTSPDDEFQSSDSSLSLSPTVQTSTSANPAGSFLSTLLSTILSPHTSNAISQPIMSSDGSRPIGLVIRQASMTSDENMGLSRGLLGLLGSLSSSRQNNLSNADVLSNSTFEQLLHHILMNETSHAGAPPASELLIAQLDRKTVTAESVVDLKGECSISQEHFETGDVVVSLPCGHRYKEEPIVHWLKMHNTCPVCRIELQELGK